MILNLGQKSFGLDISERALRLIQLKKNKDRAEIISSGEIEVPQDVIKNGKIVKIDEFSYLIKNLIKTSAGQKITSKYVTACLPEPNTFIKLITLTHPNSKDIISEIVNECKKHIPYALENTYLDWQFVDEKDKSKILIAVCPKEIVSNYQESLNKAYLTPKALEIEAAAICRCLISWHKPKTEPLLILDLGAVRTSLIAYQHPAALFSLSISFSSDNLTKILKEKLKLSDEESLKAKKLCGLDPRKAEGSVRKILEPLIDKLATQIREAKYFYHEHFSRGKDLDINLLMLTGGGSGLPFLADYLKNKCDMEVNIANPLINLTEIKGKKFIDNIQSFTTAIGLALRVIQK
ncbi:type IV pilus assembly protein PilM [Patescibacteria group bacterium]|nr:type IV pilus assembly protein PilM [Patescibacteria group bacterium]